MDKTNSDNCNGIKFFSCVQKIRQISENLISRDLIYIESLWKCSKLLSSQDSQFEFIMLFSSNKSCLQLALYRSRRHYLQTSSFTPLTLHLSASAAFRRSAQRRWLTSTSLRRAVLPVVCLSPRITSPAAAAWKCSRKMRQVAPSALKHNRVWAGCHNTLPRLLCARSTSRQFARISPPFSDDGSSRLLKNFMPSFAARL